MKNRIFTRQFLCGRNSLDLQIYIFFSPIIIIIQPLNNIANTDTSNLLLITISSVFSFFILLATIKTFQLIFIKKKEYSPIPVWLIFVIGNLTGAVKGVALFLVNNELGVTTDSDLLVKNQIIFAILAWGVLVPVFAATSNQIALVKDRRLIIMDELLLEESVKLVNEDRLTQIKKSVRLAIESDVSLLMQEVQTQITKSKDSTLEERYQQISKVLLDSAENFVRPLSHKLMLDNRMEFPSPTLLQIFTLALRKPILPIFPILVLNTISSLTVLLRLELSSFQLIAICLQQIGLLAILIFSLKKFIAIFKHFVIPATLFMLALNVYLSALFLKVFNSQISGVAEVNRLVLNFVWEVSFFIIVSFIYNLFRNELDVRLFVKQLIDSSKIDQSLAQDEALRVQYDIARYLHGNLQSRMMSLGLTLKMSQQQDEESMSSAMSIADSLLNSPFAEYLDQHTRTLIEEVDFAVGKWDGLLNVKTDIEDLDAKLSFVQKRAIGAVVEEALANALRHGFAKEVNIRIYQGKTGISIDITDDGIGPRMQKPGLGTRLYDLVAINGWSLQYRLDGFGSILELRI
jgi:signal transduction histidine kinase